MPSLEHELSYGFGKKIDAFDADMETRAARGDGRLRPTGLDRRRPAAGQARPRPAGRTGPKKGKVFRIHGPDVFIDLPGGRSQGVLPMMQFPEGPPDDRQRGRGHIEGFDNANGLLILSRKGAAVEADWSSVAEGMTVEARVTETNKGGLAVDVNGIRGFMPISQIDLYRVEDAEQFVNQKLLLHDHRGRPGGAQPRRQPAGAAGEGARGEPREAVDELAEGQVHEGIVRSVKDFGAFVDIGGVDGLLHVSEMSWTARAGRRARWCSRARTVKVVVLKLDREKRKVSLGLKQLTASPWDDVRRRSTRSARSSRAR